MSDFTSARDAITPEFIAEIGECIRDNRRVYRLLPDGGRLHLDRPLPFLCVHRLRAEDAGSAQLLLGQVSFLIAPDSPAVAALADAVTRALADRFGAVLLLEIWTRADDNGGANADFRVYSGEEASATPIETSRLQDALNQMQWSPFAIEAAIEPLGNALGWQPLLDENSAKSRSCRVLGLEVPPKFRDARGGPIYPSALQKLRRELGIALQKTCADWMQVQTAESVEDFRALGLRQLDDAVWQADREICEIAEGWNFLLGVTPVNAQGEWQNFEHSGYAATPTFHHRLLPFDPDLLKRQLYNIELERVESPALQALFHEKRLELDRQITLLEDRQTPRFLPGSMALYGGIEAPLLELANQILARTRADDDDESGERINAQQLAARAQSEIDFYRAQFPALSSRVEVRADVPGVMVAAGQLLIGENFSYAAAQLEDLIAHEVGTHIVSYANGAAQPLRLLCAGFPDYDPLQEGTALLAEWFSGGLHPSRLRILAARVWAVDALISGADFVETFRALHRDFGYDARAAWSLTMRVYRGGGLVKDAVYLRGLVWLLDYLAQPNAEWELLWSGKVSGETLPLLRELHLRGVLQPMPLRPRFLDEAGAPEKLRKLRAGLTVLDLLREITL